MGRHSIVQVPGGQLSVPAGRASKRPSKKPIRRPFVLSVLSVLAAFGIMLVMVVDPYSGAYADQAESPNHWAVVHGQTYVANGSFSIKPAAHDSFGVHVPKAKLKVASTVTASSEPGAPTAPAPSPGSAQAIAKAILDAKGSPNSQYSCLVSLWDRESGWNVHAANASGAYGIPQALPGNKMASAGPDWQNNAKTQILWGLGYIDGRYGSPCAAWSHSQSTGWY
jgi:hypothetical protein